MGTTLEPQLTRWPTAQPGEAWPIGAVFVSVLTTNPGLMLGYGTWTQFGAGRFLAGFSSGDPNFGTLLGTGGDVTKTISAHTGTAVADHADHTHSVTSNVTAGTTGATAGGDTVLSSITNNAVTSGGASATLTHSVTQPANHTPLNVLPPYIVVYFWRRTA